MNVSYITSVDEVMNLNGTNISDWVACPVVETQDGPLVTYPTGYDHGQSPYSGGVDACCEICGHKIKRVYGIQCDRLQLTLCVGSECVTHFADGLTGEQVARQQELAKAKVDAGACAAWLQPMSRLMGQCGWINTHTMANDLINSYNDAENKAEWYLRRLKTGSKLHQFLVKVVKLRTKLEAKPGGLGHGVVEIPEFLIKALDKMEGAVTVWAPRLGNTTC